MVDPIDLVIYLLLPVWKMEEPQSYTHAYTQIPSPTSAEVTDESSPVELFCRFFFLMKSGI